MSSRKPEFPMPRRQLMCDLDYRRQCELSEAAMIANFIVAANTSDALGTSYTWDHVLSKQLEAGTYWRLYRKVRAAAPDATFTRSWVQRELSLIRIDVLNGARRTVYL